MVTELRWNTNFFHKNCLVIQKMICFSNNYVYLQNLIYKLICFTKKEEILIHSFKLGSSKNCSISVNHYLFVSFGNWQNWCFGQFQPNNYPQKIILYLLENILSSKRKIHSKLKIKNWFISVSPKNNPFLQSVSASQFSKFLQ
jgi:hypothetical protein